MIPLLLMFGSVAFAQTSFKTIVDDSILKKESMARTVFIRMFTSADTSAPVKASGIILEKGYLLTNEHVLRPHLEGKKVAFHIFTHGKRILHKFENIRILGCDKANDICLLKTDAAYNDSWFSFESPSFRTITTDKPVGLFKDETIYFNGFCSEFPETKKAKYNELTSSAYETKIAGLENRSVNTTAINFSSVSGDGIACGGDSGGPLFDANLYLYGMVRDSVLADYKKKNYAVPVSVLRDFFKKTKDNQSVDTLKTIMDFSELGNMFK